MDLQVRYWSLGYFVGVIMMCTGVVFPLAWMAVKRKFVRSRHRIE